MYGSIHLVRPVAVLAVAALTLAVSMPAKAAFTEDFASWQNNDNDRLDGPDAELNGWALNNAERFYVRSLGDRPFVLDNPVASRDLPEKTGGRAHEQDLAGVTQIDLSFSLQNNFADSLGQIGAADGNQNGYGLELAGGDAATDTLNTLTIVKLAGGTQAFGSTRDAAQQNTASLAYVDAVSTDFETLHLRIEQAAAGEPVTLTAWSDGLAGSSYETPLLQVVDGGGDSAFTGDVLDLASLTHVALGADRSSTSGGEVRIDEIHLQAIPEPATLGLLVAGGALMLGRRKRPA